jgi:hypothetical protein
MNTDYGRESLKCYVENCYDTLLKNETWFVFVIFDVILNK